MAKTPAEFEKEFVASAKEKTGRTVEEWMPVLKATGLEKQMELLGMLKKKHGFNHLQANLLAGIFRNGGRPVYGAEDELLDAQFAKCEVVRPLFTAFSEKLLADYPGTKMIPKKTYVSFAADREFVAVNIKPQELRLGLDLGTEPLGGILEKARLSGPMPRISHMIVLQNIDGMNEAVERAVRQSYERSNQKK